MTHTADRLTRRKVLLFAALGIVLTLLGLGGYTAWLRATAPSPPAVPLQGADPAVVIVVQDAEDMVRRAPRSGPDWGALGMVLYAHGFQSQALDSFAQAERFDTSDPRWPYFRGLCLLALDSDPSHALPALKRAAALAGDTPDSPRLTLAETLLGLGRFDEAEPLLRQAAQRDPGSARVLLGLGRLALARENLTEAHDDLVQAYQSAPTVKAINVLLAQVAERQGDAKMAAALNTQAAKLSDDAGWPDAIAAQADALQVGKVAEIHRGEEAVINGQFDDAVVQMEQTTEKYPDSGRAWMLLGAGYVGRGEYASGETALRKAIALDPGSGETANHLGDALAHEGRVAEAAQWFQKAVAINPQSAEFHFNLGVCLYLEHNSAAAVKEFEESIRLDPDAVKGHASLADALAQEHQTAAAIQQYQIGLRLNPHDPILEKSLAKLQGQKSP